MALIVSVLLTATGVLYNVPTVWLGVLPSVVYRIDAPDVVSLIVTFCADVYVPATGLNVGVAVAPLAAIVYKPDATALFANPGAIAIALSVSVVLTTTGPEY